MSEARHWNRNRGVSFKDDLLAVEDIDESGVDVIDGPATSREEEDEEDEEEEDLLDDLPPPADLIDVIGPAPSSRLVEEIPEPAPRDPDLLLNMVTYREQSDFREPVDEKSIDDFNGPYYPQASAVPPRDRVAADYGSLQRNGHLVDDSASRFTYGTYRRHQMSRFQRSDPPYQPQPRHHRSSSDQYDMSYFDSDEFSFRRQRPPITRADSDESYRRYGHLSDNQPNPLSYASDFREKESPSSYPVQGKPLVNLETGGSVYQQQQPPEEDMYQNIGVRRSSREDYGTTVNGKTQIKGHF